MGADSLGSWIKYDHPGPKSEPFCVLNIQECFPSSSRQERGWDSSSIFKQITFKQPECGDCLIMALLSLSGTKGLEGFLPPAEDSLNFKDRHANPDGLDSPILPLTKKWEDADFSFNVNVPHGMSPRSLATRLLLRYQYTMGRVRVQMSYVD